VEAGAKFGGCAILRMKGTAGCYFEVRFFWCCVLEGSLNRAVWNLSSSYFSLLLLTIFGYLL